MKDWRSASRKLLLGMVAVLSVAQQAAAQITVVFDPAHTKIRWTLKGNVHDTHGTFQLKSGTVSLDSAGNATGLVVIEAASGESAEAARDARMQKEVLESSKFPLITFRPTHVDGHYDPATSTTLSVIGVFNLHGQDHPLTLTIGVKSTSSGAAATAQFNVPYVGWGLKDPSTFVFRVSKEVSVSIEAEAAVK